MLDSIITSKTELEGPLFGGLPAGQAGVAKAGWVFTPNINFINA